MPELPEVETIKRQLSRKILGKRIKSVDVNLEKIIKLPVKEFKKIVTGAKIKRIVRRAKLLIFNLDNNYSLIIHLKMSGQLIIDGEKTKHSHLVYYFDDNTFLIHNDFRQFGFIKVVPQKELNNYLAKEKYGPEPLTKEFTLNLFENLLDKRKRSKIKPLLMDQKFIVGIGNLYADEILFFAKVLPTRIAKTLKKSEIKKIYQGIKKILPAAISKRGSSADAYLDAKGKKGGYMPLIKVYQRENKPCYICKTKIKRIKINSRSAHFCPRCQR